MPSMAEAVIRPATRLAGRIRVPGDKSISHRYAILGALSEGATRLVGYAPGADCAATLACLGGLGVQVDEEPGSRQAGCPVITVIGRGLHGLQAPSGVLDAANSGTTLRLLAGVTAAHPFTTVITGDASLRRRPMRRVIEPLERMGARIEATDGRAPLRITGGMLAPLTFAPPVPSAQVKSAVLLAGLQTPGPTTVLESIATRDHTELALRAFGARITSAPGAITVDGDSPLTAIDARIPGDVSSATFWLVAAAARPGSELEVEGVGLNPTRTALLDVLVRAGATIERVVERVEHGEPCGRLRLRAGQLAPLVVTAAEVPGLIDELPALAAMAACGGDLHVSGAGELRVKESDRISALVTGLRALGVEAEEFEDGFHVRGHRRPAGGEVDAAGDHRLAMAFAIVALASERPSQISGADAVAVSYPGFFDTLATLTREDG